MVVDCGQRENDARMKEEQNGFKIHRTIYTCIIGLLIVINLTVTPKFIWFVFPMLGWGMGLTVHYINMRSHVNKV